MKGFILKQHEAAALAAGKPVVIWRACKPPKWVETDRHGEPHWMPAENGDGTFSFVEWSSDEGREHQLPVPFPVGVPLFGKETWAPNGVGKTIASLLNATEQPSFYYRATHAWPVGWRWRPAQTMKEEASRITITLSDVRVRKPCDVTGDEACDMITEECRAKAPYMESKGTLADWHIRAFKKQFSIHNKTDWNLYHFSALATPTKDKP